MDRISQLPDLAVNRILSSLIPYYGPPKELVRMSVLSKAWFHLTASFPDLYFVSDNFISRESFFKYVEYTTSRFCHQNLPAHRLRLFTTIQDPAELDIVNRCLELALNNGVEELMIDIINSSETPKYRLPNTLLSVGGLKSLNIHNCDLPSSLMVDVVKFKSLNFLKLDGVDIDNEAIGYLITSCPLLQRFHIENCNGFDGFCVYGHQNLLNVSIFDAQLERIDIDAPNLSELEISQADEEPPQMNVASCKKLTTVTYFSYPLRSSNGLTDFLSNFQFIENYTFSASTEGNNLKLSSRSLKRLMVHSECDLEDIELNTPNLDLFVYSCIQLSLSRVGRSTRLKACMICYLDDSIDTLWFHELRLFLGKKKGFKALNLCIRTRTSQKFTELEELKAIELPCYELEHVELLLDDEHGESSNYAAFVDAVLWCCRPRSLTLISSSSLNDFDEQNDVVLFTYEKLLQQEDQSHTNIKIVSPSSLLVTIPRNSKAISFIKEEVIQEEADNQRFAGLKIF